MTIKPYISFELKKILLLRVRPKTLHGFKCFGKVLNRELSENVYLYPSLVYSL